MIKDVRNVSIRKSKEHTVFYVRTTLIMTVMYFRFFILVHFPRNYIEKHRIRTSYNCVSSAIKYLTNIILSYILQPTCISTNLLVIALSTALRFIIRLLKHKIFTLHDHNHREFPS